MKITNTHIAVGVGATLVSAALITLGLLGKKISLNKNVSFGLVAGGTTLAGLTVVVGIAIRYCSRQHQRREMARLTAQVDAVEHSTAVRHVGPPRDIAEEYQKALHEYSNASLDGLESHRKKLKDLIADGADPLTHSTKSDLGHDAGRRLGSTILHIAAVNGDLELIRHLKTHHRREYDIMKDTRGGPDNKTPLDSVQSNLSDARGAVTSAQNHPERGNAAERSANNTQAAQRHQDIIKALS